MHRPRNVREVRDLILRFLRRERERHPRVITALAVVVGTGMAAMVMTMVGIIGSVGSSARSRARLPGGFSLDLDTASKVQGFISAQTQSLASVRTALGELRRDVQRSAATDLVQIRQTSRATAELGRRLDRLESFRDQATGRGGRTSAPPPGPGRPASLGGPVPARHQVTAPDAVIAVVTALRTRLLQGALTQEQARQELAGLMTRSWGLPEAMAAMVASLVLEPPGAARGFPESPTPAWPLADQRDQTQLVQEIATALERSGLTLGDIGPMVLHADRVLDQALTRRGRRLDPDGRVRVVLTAASRALASAQSGRSGSPTSGPEQGLVDRPTSSRPRSSPPRARAVPSPGNAVPPLPAGRELGGAGSGQGAIGAGPWAITPRTVVIPAGAYGDAYLVSGATVEVGGAGDRPVLLELPLRWQGPGGSWLTLPKARLIGQANALPGPERISIRLVRLSFVFPDGRAVTVPVNGYVADQLHGIEGAIGSFHLNADKVLPAALGSGILEGAGTSLGQRSTITSVTSGGTTTTVAPGNQFTNALMAGGAQGASVIDAYVKGYLSAVKPTVEAPNGQPLTAILLEDAAFTGITTEEWNSLRSDARGEGFDP